MEEKKRKCDSYVSFSEFCVIFLPHHNVPALIFQGFWVSILKNLEKSKVIECSPPPPYVQYKIGEKVKIRSLFQKRL